MKLVTYSAAAGPRCGVLQDDQIIDATALLQGAQPLRDVQALLETGPDAIPRLQDALAAGRSNAPVFDRDDVRIQSPILRPPTIRDFMIFEEHATQQGTREREEAWYRMPIFYFSNPLCVYGPEDTIPYPAAAEMLDYELEIACVIGREGVNVAEADALDYIAGFCIFNDWSCRDLQRDESAVGLGPAKGKDAASSLGPCLVTTDELMPYLKEGRLGVKCSARVNGVTWVEDSDGGLAWHTWGAMVERAARDSRIAPGDVLGCGTVGGGSIGEAIRKGYPARFLQPGDVVEHEVEGIGILRNTIGPKGDLPADYRYRAKAQPRLPEAGSAAGYVYELRG